MQIALQEIGKRFRYEWVFSGINLDISAAQSTAILGHNGSGKSTLLQIIAGHLTPNKGKISYIIDNQVITEEEKYKYLTYTAPYMDLIEEFTLLEAIDFHRQFKPIINGVSNADLLDILQLPKNNAQKEVRFFSSGMKQRLKLLVGICSDVPLVLLDEPTTNLDAQGIDWYRDLVTEFKRDRLFIVASNTPHDYDFCIQKILMSDFKLKNK